MATSFVTYSQLLDQDGDVGDSKTT
jgi:hypothetical protein